MPSNKTKKKDRAPKPKPGTILAYVDNVTDVDPTVSEVTVTYSGKAFYKLLKAMMLAKAAKNIGHANDSGQMNDLQNEVAIECAEMLQAAVDEMGRMEGLEK